MTHTKEQITAIHEAGHAIALLRVGGAKYLDRVSIIADGSNLGGLHTSGMALTDLAYIAVCLGGMVAVEIMTGQKPDYCALGANGSDLAKAEPILKALGMTIKAGRQYVSGLLSPMADDISKLASALMECKSLNADEILNLLTPKH